MTGVDLIEQVEGLPDGGADRLAAVDELPAVADVGIEVRQKLLGHFDAYLGHTLRISDTVINVPTRFGGFYYSVRERSVTMTEYTRRGVLAALGAGMAVTAGTTVAGADDHEREQEDVARVVHLSPDAPALDIYVDGELWFEGVEPLTLQEGATPAEPGTYDVTAVPTGEESGNALVETETTIEPGPSTLAVIGEVCALSGNGFDLVALKGEFGPTRAGHARVRVVHASPDTPTVDVETESGETIAEGLSFGESRTKEIPAGETIVAVRSTDGTTLARFEIAPEAGHVYSAFGVGYQDPESAPEAAPDDLGFSLAISEDAAPGEQ